MIRRACVLVAILLMTGTAAAQHRGWPLIEQVKLDSPRTVIFIGPDRESGIIRPRNISLERWHASGVDFVAVLDVQSVTGKALYNGFYDRLGYGRDVPIDPTGERPVPAPEHIVNWVISTIRASVGPVLSGTLKPGTTLTFDVEGGIVMLQGHEIELTEGWRKPLEAGKRYLVFGGFSESHGPVRLGRSLTYEEPSPDAKLVNTDILDFDNTHKLTTMSLDAAVAFLRQELR